ncbi:hypothetical protein CAPTEDRAFT_190567 [Capitella teleta]|uniref:Ig-like domain-containing protein n=1 Tax=Capitella teleta TaxID=283909 RepID=R7TU12_CAPTE|nr:hypothetical protein CAPTEDRAFT_190567 [Capitella teleta]|eukprot:ELT97383.1 hypothetical protein CAPTEDRAFT_190567 [Capitella teleta]
MEGLLVLITLIAVAGGEGADDLEAVSPPEIQDEYTKLQAVEGDRVRLMCRVTGEPRPTVKWHRRGSLLPLGDRYEVGRNALTIRSVQLNDTDQYACLAKNVNGEAWLDFNLIIIPGWFAFGSSFISLICVAVAMLTFEQDRRLADANRTLLEQEIGRRASQTGMAQHDYVTLRQVRFQTIGSHRKKVRGYFRLWRKIAKHCL